VFVLSAAAQTVPVLAYDGTILAFDGVNFDHLTFPGDKGGQEAGTEAENSVESVGGGVSYKELGLSIMDISALSQFIDIEEITEKEFYDLNFGMKIASVALTSENALLLRTTDNTYHTIKISDDYIRAMELTGVVEKGASQKIAVKEQKKPGIFTSFILASLVISLVIMVGWFFIMNRRAYEPERTGINAKDKGKTAPACR
jgi:hypothetical protein